MRGELEVDEKRRGKQGGGLKGNEMSLYGRIRIRKEELRNQIKKEVRNQGGGVG